MMPDGPPSSMGRPFLGGPPRRAAFAPAALRPRRFGLPYVRKNRAFGNPGPRFPVAESSRPGASPPETATAASRDGETGGGIAKTPIFPHMGRRERDGADAPGRRPDRRWGRGARPGVTRQTEDRNECLTRNIPAFRLPHAVKGAQGDFRSGLRRCPRPRRPRRARRSPGSRRRPSARRRCRRARFRAARRGASVPPCAWPPPSGRNRRGCRCPRARSAR